MRSGTFTILLKSMSRKVQTAVKINKDRKGTMQILFPTMFVTPCDSTYPKYTCCVNISSKLCHFDQVRRWDYQSSFVVEFLYRFRAYLIHSTTTLFQSHIFKLTRHCVLHYTHMNVIWCLVLGDFNGDLGQKTLESRVKRRVSIDSIPLWELLKATH